MADVKMLLAVGAALKSNRIKKERGSKMKVWNLYKEMVCSGCKATVFMFVPGIQTKKGWRRHGMIFCPKCSKCQ